MAADFTTYNPIRSVPRIAAPVLLVAATNDTLCNFALAERAARLNPKVPPRSPARAASFPKPATRRALVPPRRRAAAPVRGAGRQGSPGQLMEAATHYHHSHHAEARSGALQPARMGGHDLRGRRGSVSPAVLGPLPVQTGGRQGAACTLLDTRARPVAQVQVSALDVGHFDVYMGPAFDRTVADQLAFLQARAGRVGHTLCARAALPLRTAGLTWRAASDSLPVTGAALCAAAPCCWVHARLASARPCRRGCTVARGNPSCTPWRCLPASSFTCVLGLGLSYPHPHAHAPLTVTPLAAARAGRGRAAAVLGRRAVRPSGRPRHRRRRRRRPRRGGAGRARGRCGARPPRAAPAAWPGRQRVHRRGALRWPGPA